MAEEGKKKNAFRWHWQYLLFLTTLIFNVDSNLIPLLRGLGVHGKRLFLWTLPIGEAEVVSWYFFWRWFKKYGIKEIFARQIKKDEVVRAGIILGQEVKQQLEESGLLAKILDFAYEQYLWITSKVSKIKKSYLAMFFLGWEPFIAGGRIAGVLFCATSGWKAGLCTLLFGNVFHIAWMIGIWSLIFKYVNWKYFLGVVALLVIIRVLKYKFKRAS